MAGAVSFALGFRVDGGLGFVMSKLVVPRAGVFNAFGAARLGTVDTARVCVLGVASPVGRFVGLTLRPGAVGFAAAGFAVAGFGLDNKVDRLPAPAGIVLISRLVGEAGRAGPDAAVLTAPYEGRRAVLWLS